MIDRYTQLEKVETKGYVIPGPYIDPTFLTVKETESTYKVGTGYAGRPDLIAQAVYGDSALFWVIIAYNNVTKVMNWPQIGEVIRYPRYDKIVRESF